MRRSRSGGDLGGVDMGWDGVDLDLPKQIGKSKIWHTTKRNYWEFRGGLINCWDSKVGFSSGHKTIPIPVVHEFRHDFISEGGRVDSNKETSGARACYRPYLTTTATGMRAKRGCDDMGWGGLGDLPKEST